MKLFPILKRLYPALFDGHMLVCLKSSFEYVFSPGIQSA